MAKGKKNGKAAPAKKTGNGNGKAAEAAKKTAPEAVKMQPVFTLVRKSKATGAIEPRKAGRPHPDYEYGYTDKDNNFHAGEPPSTKRKPGRPAGSASKPGRKPGRKPGSGLNEIESIVQKEVDSRLRMAHAAAINAFSSALNLK